MVNTLTDTHYSPIERKWMARIVFLCIFCSLVYSWIAGVLLHQLQQPVLRFPYVDLTYWVMHGLQIPEFLSGHFIVACVFDAALFIACIISFLFPEKRLFIVSFIVLYFIYFITFNTYGTHHSGHKWGILLIAVPFVVADIRSFNYLWQGLRYFIVFGFSCAFLYKLFRLSWLHPGQGILIMKRNIVSYLYFNPDTGWAGLYRWLLSHPQLVNVLMIAGFLLEGSFIIGFFTKKYDRWLLLIFVLLVFGFWLMADAHFFELLILGWTLVSFRRFFSRSHLP